MKNLFRITLFCATALLISFTSCKKSSTNDEDTSELYKELANDESNMHMETESILSDVNTVMENSSLGKVYPKGVSVDDSSFISMRKIIVTFNGDNAAGTRTRSGTVTLTLVSGSKWTDSSAVIEIKYVKVMVKRKANLSKTVEFNGTFYMRNVTGGRVFIDNDVIHKFWGTGTLSFDGDVLRVWNFNRKRTFMVNGALFSVKTEGDTAVAGKSNILAWGVNRKGTPVFTQVNQPVVISSACPAGPVSGIKLHSGLEKEVKVTFGVNDKGEVVTTGCPFGFKVEWTNADNQPRTSILSY